MAQVYLSVGSNIERCQHITAALDALQDKFGTLSISTVYESEAIGFEGDPFFNLAVGFSTSLSVSDLSAGLRQIETDNGRQRNGLKFSSRTLDIDILLYDNFSGLVEKTKIPRAEITQYAFVLKPLSELAGEQRHPQLGSPYKTLWQQFDKELQPLWPVDFYWQGKQISVAK